MRRVILGTAGHIDHGKTALIKALTGIDTDRLREEKARGISIDLGFAHIDLPGDLKVGIVDVPGHEKFIKNMLAGVGGIDLVLFVVACDEGIMPQTREHFDIISLLGVSTAIFALTKSDLVDAEMIDMVREEVEDLIKETRFEGAALVATSTRTGDGVKAVREAIEEAVAGIEERKIGAAVRLPVDRVFTMTGRGTVVTGTLWAGTVSKEDRLEILPGPKPVRVRSVEVHGSHVDSAYAGQRTALGVHGVNKHEIERGDCVVSPGDFTSTRVLDAEVRILATSPRVLKHKARIRFHLGASEVMGRIFLIGREALRPGEKCFAQVRLEDPLVAGFGDLFVLRTYSPMRTIGGGTVLDPSPLRRRKRDKGISDWLTLLATADMKQIVEGHIKASGLGTRLDMLRLRLNRGSSEIETAIHDLKDSAKIFEPSPGLYIHADVLAELEGRIEETLESYQAKQRLIWGMPKEELREKLGSVEMAFLNWVLGRLEDRNRVFSKKGRVRAGSGDVKLSQDEVRARSVVVGQLKARLFQPPSERDLETGSGVPAETVRKVITLLINDGEITRLEPGLVVHSTAIEEARSRIEEYLREHGEATVSDLKGVLGTSRKYAVPLLERLDRLGITRRQGANRTLI
ncbi:MAG: selenocysteine-specific translation elongation factor [Candidatus Eisenbacteria bacterium]